MESDLRERFGTLLERHRKRRGLTREALSDATKISEDMIRSLETRKSGASFKTIAKLATALEIDFAELFTAELPKSATGNAKLSSLKLKVSKVSEADQKLLDAYVDLLLRRPS